MIHTNGRPFQCQVSWLYQGYIGYKRKLTTLMLQIMYTCQVIILHVETFGVLVAGDKACPDPRMPCLASGSVEFNRGTWLRWSHGGTTNGLEPGFSRTPSATCKKSLMMIIQWLVSLWIRKSTFIVIINTIMSLYRIWIYICVVKWMMWFTGSKRDLVGSRLYHP